MRSKIASTGLIVVMLTMVVSVMPAQSQNSQAASLPQLEEVLAFDLTLERLAAQVSAGDVGGIPKDRYLTVDGVVSSRQLVNDSEQDFLGILELSSGSWVDGEELEIYRCYVQLRGPEFVGTVPKPRSRETSANEIPLHAKILLIGRYLGYGEDQDGNRFPVLLAEDFRILN